MWSRCTMSATIDLYLIQSPDVLADDNNVRGYNRDLLTYYRNSSPIKDMTDFLWRVAHEVGRTRKLINKLVIGSHGYGSSYDVAPYGSGGFYIGKDSIETDNDAKINRLRV